MGPQLEALAHAKKNLVLRRIDIDTWESPVARQYGVRRLPSLWLYDGTARVSTHAEDVYNRARALP